MFKKNHPKRSNRKLAAKRKPPKRRKPVKAIREIVRMREKVGLSCNALYEAAGIDPKYGWNLERGLKRNPGRMVLIKLVRVLVSFTKIYDESHVDKVLALANFPAAPSPPKDPRPTFLTSELYR